MTSDHGETSKPNLLLLCHRIPYPPNKGDKIRSYHLLTHLAKRYSIFLGTFVDDEADWKYVDKVRSLCEQSLLLELNPKLAMMKGLLSFVTKEPITLKYYSNRILRKWVDDLLSSYDIESVVIYSSTMAQYVINRESIRPLIVDFVDVDSDKWLQYAQSKPFPLSWLYRREARLLGHFDSEVDSQAGVSFFVSEKEATLFRNNVSQGKSQVDFYMNGVDCTYFDPESSVETPFPSGAKAIVFTGAMDYWANVDAAFWFSERVFPQLLQKFHNLRFYIVGSNPSEKLLKLNSDRIVVTGGVEDIRRYIKFAEIVVAPMQIARGIQNKILEGMAMAKPVVATTKAHEGLSAIDGEAIVLADQPDEFSMAITDMMENRDATLGERARNYVLENHSWESCLKRFDRYLPQNPERPSIQIQGIN